MTYFLNLLTKVYLAVTAFYGTVFLSCLVGVPLHVQSAVYEVIVGSHPTETMIALALFGVTWAHWSNR